MKKFCLLLLLISCTQTYYTEEILPGDLMVFAPEGIYIEVFDSTGKKVSDGFSKSYNFLTYYFDRKPKSIVVVKGSNYGCETLNVKIKEDEYCPLLINSRGFKPSSKCDVCEGYTDGEDTITIIVDFDVVYVSSDTVCASLKRQYKDNVFVVRGLNPGEYRVKVDTAEFKAYVSSKKCNVLIAR